MASVSLAQILRSVGFSEGQISTFLGIAKAESGGNPLAIHNNALPNYPQYRDTLGAGASREFSIGLFQINLSPATGRLDPNTGKITAGHPFAGQSWEVLLDPTNNATYAKSLSANPSNWSTYHPGITGSDVQVNEPDDNIIKRLWDNLNPLSLGAQVGGGIATNVQQTVGSAVTSAVSEVQKNVMSGAFGALGIGMIVLGFYFIARPYVNKRGVT